MCIEELTSEAIGLLKGLIGIPSVSKEEKNAADFLESFIRKSDIFPHRAGNNLWCICNNFNGEKPTILLNSHIDTVKPAHDWTKDPFSPIEENGCIYGLGSNDAGASLVSLFEVFKELNHTQQNYNLIYLASCEEEISGKNGISSVLSLLPKIDLALVGEPTGMQPAIAEKGLMVLDVTTYGKAGHAARNEGDNSIYKALGDIEWFRDYKFEKDSPLLGPVKMTVTQINAGIQHNIIPDRCSFVVDVRSNECYTNEEIFDIIRSSVKSEVAARSFRLNSSRIDSGHPFMKRTLELGRTPFGSPTLSDQALMKCPSLKMGPGESSRSHTANEYIKEEEIRQAITLYLNILDGLTL